jgi:chromosome segregation ATPase
MFDDDKFRILAEAWECRRESLRLERENEKLRAELAAQAESLNARIADLERLYRQALEQGARLQVKVEQLGHEAGRWPDYRKQAKEDQDELCVLRGRINGFQNGTEYAKLKEQNWNLIQTLGRIRDMAEDASE